MTSECCTPEGRAEGFANSFTLYIACAVTTLHSIRTKTKVTRL